MAKYNLKYTGQDIDGLLDTVSDLPPIIQSLLCSARYSVPTIIKDESTSKYILQLPYKLEQYEIGQAVCLQGATYNGISTFDEPLLQIGDLAPIQVDGTIKSGKCYNLMYDGTKFQAQVTTMGVNGTPLVFTTSGTYTIDSDLTYKVTLVGGGGGGAGSSAYMVSGGRANGGGGGITVGEWTPTSSTISVTIGKAGESKGYRDSSGGGTDGGATIACGFTAAGGTGGYSHLGGDAEHGTTGAGGNLEGYYHNGTYYGKAGISSGTQPTAGIVILVPIL